MNLPTSLIDLLHRFSGRRALAFLKEGNDCLLPIAETFEHVDAFALPGRRPVANLDRDLPANVQQGTWDGRMISVPESSYDAVFVLQVAGEAADWKNVLKESLQVLRQRGQLVIIEYNSSPYTEQQAVFLELERLMQDKNAVLRQAESPVLSIDDIRREMKALDVHHLRLSDIAGDDFSMNIHDRNLLKRESLDRIRTDLLPDLCRLGTRRDEFERRLVDLKRRIEVTGIAPSGYSLIHGIKKTVYAAAETSLFAAESFSPDPVTAEADTMDDDILILSQGVVIRHDVDHLSTHELLALAMAGHEPVTRYEKLSERIMREYGSRAVAQEKEPQALVESLGISPQRANQIIAIFELGRRFYGASEDDAPVLRGPEDIVRHVGDMTKLKREQFRGLYMNSRQKLVADEVISIGTLTSALIHPREVFRPALSHRAVSVILVHNHPSGDPEPSTDDIEMTRQLNRAGQILGITLLDHVIVGGDSWFSMKNAELI
jgi:DNA repair protein RadC